MSLIKYYAVVKGVCPGIYTSWDKARSNTYKFPGAVFKSFLDKKEAEIWFHDQQAAHFEKDNQTPVQKVIVYTATQCETEPGPGRYIADLVCGEHRKTISNAYRFTTHCRMELMAFIFALRALRQKSSVTFYSGSENIVNIINSGQIKLWRQQKWLFGEKLLNDADLWQQLFYLTQRHTVTAEFKDNNCLAGKHNRVFTDKISIDPISENLFVSAGQEAVPLPLQAA